VALAHRARSRIPGDGHLSRGTRPYGGWGSTGTTGPPCRRDRVSFPLLAPREMYLWPEGGGVSPLFHFGFGFGFSKSL
jgi:hypothetical protein